MQYYNNRMISNTQRPVFDVTVSRSNFNSDNGGGNDSGNDDVVDDNFDNDDYYGDELYEDDYDYEDEDINAGRAFGNSLWIAFAGLLLLWSAKALKLTGTSANIARLLGTIFIVWAIIVFFSKF